MFINLENNQKKIALDAGIKGRIRDGLNAVAKLHGIKDAAEVGITIVDDKKIRALNKKYRHIDRATDVLSFALNEDGGGPDVPYGPEKDLLGDIVISAETAKRQGEEFGHGLEREMVYLAVHGLLHILGFNHEKEAEKKIMRTREEEALRAVKLSEEYLEKDMEKKLLKAALAARKNAYAPYSGFKVGAAVMSGSGRIFPGCNVENASYGLCCCAERNAIFSAVAKGGKDLRALCVVADTKGPVEPCGACRQVIAEFKIPRVILSNLKGDIREFTWEELLPFAFTLDGSEQD